MNSDPGSLQNLNDIVLPASVPWWPLAMGWYIIAVMVVLLLTFFTYRSIRVYRANRYRRSALEQLELLRAQNNADAVRSIPVLLKQVALAVFPRQKVASLCGSEWSEFLDNSSAGNRFQQSSGKLLEKLSCTHDVLDQSEIQCLFTDAEAWIREHHSAGLN